ncbi:MAG: hypothetical protein [Arizlama microvirus]|nr:MAG: hypothetical protein [Arizlama microvirus]
MCRWLSERYMPLYDENCEGFSAGMVSYCRLIQAVVCLSGCNKCELREEVSNENA